MKKVLAINSGSSSFKYQLFAVKSERVLAKGMADRVGLSASTFSIKLADGSEHKEKIAVPDQQTAVKILLRFLKKYQVVNDFSEIAGVGHRVVAGGKFFTDSTIIDQRKLQKIFDLTQLAPLHNMAQANGIAAFMKLLPHVPQVGVFDTTYHQSLDPVHYLYSLPYSYYKKYGIRKYGAHGTSVRYIVARASQLLHLNPKQVKMIVCHLGSGASVTAVKNGRSFDTSMGFSPLAGLTMAARSGDVDPSLLQFIMDQEDLDIDQMIEILNEKSGLLGISGVSPDMRDVRKSKSRRARLARTIFVNRLVRYIGAYIAEMGGVQAIVFTAGIGEHDADLRAQVMRSFAFMGVKPDLATNALNGENIITRKGSAIIFLVIPTNEELMIAREVMRLSHLE